MMGVIIGIHIFVCILLIAIILLQTGKGAEIGAVFGGGVSTTLFGPAGPTGLFTKITIVLAAIFMLTSIFFTLFSAKPPIKSVIEGKPPIEAPLPR
jgi:preprotein translocase subunit SecG